MATHRIHSQKDCFYFITFTCYKWLPLFQLTALDDYFHLWMSRLNDKGILISAYVMMPNHLHLLVFVDKTCNNINLNIGESKRFMAYEIIKRLRNKSSNRILSILEKGVSKNEILKRKKHQVFRLSFDAKKVEGLDELTKVAEYIHHNPVTGKWRLAEDFTKYSPSSAAYYELGKPDINIRADFRLISPLDLGVSCG